MSERSSVALRAWSIALCASCTRPVAILRVDEGSELRLRLTEKEGLLLSRRSHPAYAARLRSMLEGLAERSLWFEFTSDGSGAVSSAAVAYLDGKVHRGHISPALALLAFEGGLPLYVDEALLIPSAREHLEGTVTAFAGFLETVSAEDFARFDAGRQG